MENKIVAGPFLDKIISKWALLPELQYSTNVHHTFLILNQYAENGYFKIECNTQPCYKVFKCQLNDSHGEGGHLTMAICLTKIDGLVKSLKGQNYQDIKTNIENYLEMTNFDSYYDEWTEKEEKAEEFYNKFKDIFYTLNKEQIEALIEYANDKS